MNIVLLIQRIISGKLFFTYDNKNYYHLQPDADIKYSAEIVYSQILEDNLYEPWIRTEDLPKILKDLDIWNKEDNEMLDQYRKKLDNTKLGLYNNRFNKNKIKEYKKSISDISTSINSMNLRKNSFNYLTLEDYANIKKSEYIFLNTVYDANSQRLVFDSSPSNVDHLIFDSLITEISQRFITIEEYKNIAKSEYWKGIWSGNKYNVFDRAGCDLTDEQKSLINISIMYDRIFEHPECPEEFVIDDDDMLEGWMVYQKNKAEESKKQNSSTNYANKHGNAQEIFIVGDKEDAGTIYNMNTNDTRAIIKQRSKVISTSNEGIDEVNLPDVQRNLLLKMNTPRK